MPFTVADFHDLLTLLEEHPEWQADLRAHVLSKELLEVPDLIRQLIAAQARTDERIEALAAAQQRTQEQLDALSRHVDALTLKVDAMGRRLDATVGTVLEMNYERRVGAYFGPLARRIRVVSSSALADQLDDAVEEGAILEAERRDVMRADLVFRGQRREDRRDAYFVVEVSIGIGLDDVRRAADRARMLAKLGPPAVPIVAGERIDPEPAELAAALGVWQVFDGQIRSPAGATI